MFHISEEKSVELEAESHWIGHKIWAQDSRAPLVRLLTGVSCLEMLKDPSRWARFYGTKTAKDRRSESS